MSLRREHLAEHREGHGQLIASGGSPVPVRYILDRWLEDIPTGSGTRTQMQRTDGFVWWDEPGALPLAEILQTEDGRQMRVKMHSLRANRAGWFCVGEE